MDRKSFKAAIMMVLISVFLGRVMLARAVVPNISTPVSDVVAEYGSCSWVDNDNGTSEVNLLISFKDGNRRLRNLYIDAQGDNGHSLLGGWDGLVSVSINGVKAYWTAGYVSGSYRAISGPSEYEKNKWPWNEKKAFLGSVKVILNSALTKKASSVLVVGGNTNELASTPSPVRDARAAYITRKNGGGTCQLVDPNNPPQIDIEIQASSPDWELGELSAGDGEKSFPNKEDQLCFNYSSTAVRDKSFVVNATNANGLVGNRYRLRKNDDVTQEVPYSIELQSGASTVNLPNAGAAIPLDRSGRTCFVPTFKTTVDKMLREGTYSDVLTFTIVKKT
ncbi:hypothetical protein [Burkholderia orbicola]|uniref:Uncharacterized protein n=1 Tax=Burkholderia orbicola TaxID=2978683 RepID=A0ABT8NXP0_9BURK|nr:hypothetical protein [Burkholderia orbicola]MDN7526349.1 hypothetical protein [Burkholderia orbicola]